MKKKTTISDTVYLEIRMKIMNLRIKPGTIISIKDICESMDVSRSPVRDALIRLEEEGLIESIPQVGTRITKINFDRMENERYLRNCIEYKIFLDFLEQDKISVDIEEYNRIIELQKKSILDKDIISFLKYDDEFHEVIFKMTNNEFIWKVILENQAHYRRMRLLSLTSQNLDHLNDLVEQHKKMLSYLINNEKDSLINLLNKHISDLKEEKYWLKDNHPDLIYSEDSSKLKENKLVENNFFEELINNK